MTTLLGKSEYRQRGAVLIVSLIMLVVMTLFVISMLKTSIVELKIGGSSQVVALNFSNAEVAIDNFISRNDGRFAPRFLTLAALGAGCDRNTVGPGPCNELPPGLQLGTAVRVVPTQINCGAAVNYRDNMGAGALQAVQFDLLVEATATLGGKMTLHQGLQTFATPGSC
jgi:Tfp pilus assembly protein PilX